MSKKEKIINDAKTFINALNDETKFKNYRSIDFNYKSLKEITGNDKNKIKTKKADELLRALNEFYKGITDNVDLGDKLIEKEYEFITEKGWHCVYISLILKGLMKKYCKINLNYYQGVFFYEHNEQTAWILGDTGVGFHAWCMYKDVVLDVTFLQQQGRFLISPSPLSYLNGCIAKGVTYKGQKEPEEVIQSYLNDILAVNQLSYDEWLNNIENYMSKYK